MQGKLIKNDIDRWEINDGENRYELSSGDLCEVLVGEFKTGVWFRTRIEHNGDDYYATVPGIKLYKGMPARTIEF